MIPFTVPTSVRSRCNDGYTAALGDALFDVLRDEGQVVGNAVEDRYPFGAGIGNAQQPL
jgi:hypothetical protein